MDVLDHCYEKISSLILSRVFQSTLKQEPMRTDRLLTKVWNYGMTNDHKQVMPKADGP